MIAITASTESGSAVALSVLMHVAIAILMLWRGMVWFERSGGDGDRPAVSWVALAPIASAQAEPLPTPPTRVTAPTLPPPRIERVNLALQPRVVATVLPIPLPASLPGPLPDPVGIDVGGSGGPGQGPSCGGASEVGASPGVDAGPGADDSARDILGPTPLPVPSTPAEARPDDQRTHDVQFWIRADGRVTRIAVNPPIRDSNYRRQFRATVRTFVFGKVKTPDGRPINYVYKCVVYP